MTYQHTNSKGNIMKIQTMSVVVGTSACNAKCPFCVSSTTFTPDLPTNPKRHNE